jgi:hypothetical protein
MMGAVLLWFAVVTWLFLAAVLGMRLLNEPDRFAPEARLPAAFTGIASTCVLGSAFAVHGYYPVAAGLLGLGAVGWALLAVPVVGRWKTPQVGGSFLVAVATQGVVVLSATLAARDGVGWLLVAAVVAWILGLSAYVVTLTRFDLRQLLTGRGDQWIAGGALAISALAGVPSVDVEHDGIVLRGVRRESSPRPASLVIDRPHPTGSRWMPGDLRPAS